MATKDFTKYFLYRWRFVIGYSLIGLLLIAVLVFAGLYLPGGLSDAEMRAVATSASLSLNDPASLAIANLPYYAAQAVILNIFGVSIFSVKILSLILAFIAAIGFILLLRRWFKPSIAILASLIAISTGQFLFIAQQGTPGVLYVFWPIALLLLGTQITRGKSLRFLWKILFVITAALSLYTPLSIYPLIAVVLAIALHPHLRNAVRRLSKIKLAVCMTIFGLLIVPLLLSIINNPSLAISLLGIPVTWPVDILANVTTLLKQYFMFWAPGATTVMTPVFGLGTALLIILGIWRLILTRETTRSYLIIIWLICLTPVLVLNPAFTSVTFVPSMLLLAAGLTSLISYWYRLFPLNPYARITGLVPIVILVFALIVTGLARYAFTYLYSPVVAPQFSRDLALIPEDTEFLVVSEDEEPFYQAVVHFGRDMTVTTSPDSNSFVATRQADRSFEGFEVQSIITNAHANEANRLYVYKKSAQ